MNDFFEEYGWLIASVVGGSVGLNILMGVFFGVDVPFTIILDTILGVLM